MKILIVRKSAGKRLRVPMAMHFELQRSLYDTLFQLMIPENIMCKDLINALSKPIFWVLRIAGFLAPRPGER